jgi:hypothetical protein
VKHNPPGVPPHCTAREAQEYINRYTDSYIRGLNTKRKRRIKQRLVIAHSMIRNVKFH